MKKANKTLPGTQDAFRYVVAVRNHQQMLFLQIAFEKNNILILERDIAM